ncbi:hypothetical protein NDU88_000757 [Pleurodeles waltl]|uniref:CCHC-type domain-containing protein n=1 Tax=Pleurodeles waltl TaxID=8319 RepID=A0AAV7MJ07_PLEWA|nr:hypothetical protein NDU88_000757 [Pleurodeles waltl]
MQRRLDPKNGGERGIPTIAAFLSLLLPFLAFKSCPRLHGATFDPQPGLDPPRGPGPHFEPEGTAGGGASAVAAVLLSPPGRPSSVPRARQDRRGATASWPAPGNQCAGAVPLTWCSLSGSGHAGPPVTGVRGRSTAQAPWGFSPLPRLVAVASGGAAGPTSAQPGVSRCGRHLLFPSRDQSDRRAGAGFRIPARLPHPTLQGIPGSQGCLERRLSAHLDRGHDEDVMTYVTALRGLVVTCDLRDLNDSLIRDQIVCCTNNKKVDEKLLSIDPSLEESIQIARSMEHTEAWMKEIEIAKSYMRDSNKETTVEVKEFKGKKQEKFVGNTGVKATEKKNLNIICYRCGCPGHIASSSMCAARILTCRVCGRRGHMAKVCRSKGKVLNNSVKSVDDIKDDHEEIVLTISDTEKSSQQNVESISNENLKRESSGKLEKAHCTTVLESVIVKVLVDSGSLFTLISKEIYEDVLKGKIEDFQSADVRAVGYGGKRIDI